MKVDSASAAKILRKRGYNKVARVIALSYEYNKKIRAYINDNLEALIAGDKGAMSKLRSYIKTEYSLKWGEIKDEIVNYYIENTELNIKTLPKTQALKLTNKILSTKSILKRNTVAINRIVKTLEIGIDKGYNPKKISKLIDIQLGYRNPDGEINPETLSKIKKGETVYKNGNIYQDYRIARTETNRVAGQVVNEQFTQLQDKVGGYRLRMLAKIDERTRDQSAEMNGQISNADGEFLYPDGNYYKFGEAPPEYSINDRETIYVVNENEADQ